MLIHLHIENIALIKQIDIPFSPGLTVLTGETGAGKSIILDALSLLCGARSDRSIIRSGAEGAAVEGVFGEFSADELAALAALDLTPDEDGLLFVQRKLSADGKASAKIGSRPVPASKLREVAAVLVSIHGQQDTQTLADPATQLKLLDVFAGSTPLLDEYAEAFTAFRAVSDKLERLEKNERDKADRLDMLTFRIRELEEAKLTKGEEEALTADRNRLANSEKILQAANGAYDLLYRVSGSASEKVAAASGYLDTLAGILPETAVLFERLTSLRYELEDIAEQVRDYAESDNGDPTAELDRIEERLQKISMLKRKYKNDVAGILEEYEEMLAERDGIENSAAIAEELAKQKEASLAILGEKAARLTAFRRNAADKLSEEVAETLRFLDMPGVRFGVELTESGFTTLGNDRAEFLISANAGEVPKAMSKIASGGELSRIMLALKSVGSEQTGQVMVFDEIDTGISGRTSEKIGLKLASLAETENAQVLCVTHSAQIAALADTHLLITKKEEDGRTVTNVKSLDTESRVNELSRIIGGVTVCEAVRAAARDMLNQHKKP